MSFPNEEAQHTVELRCLSSLVCQQPFSAKNYNIPE